eukprot:scaffold36335_cov58-Attheya_sp.AAC.3
MQNYTHYMTQHDSAFTDKNYCTVRLYPGSLARLGGYQHVVTVLMSCSQHVCQIVYSIQSPGGVVFMSAKTGWEAISLPT